MSVKAAEPKAVKGLGRGLVVLVLALCAGFLGIILWGAYSAVERLSAEAIERAASQTEAELDRFFEPVERLLGTSLGWAASGQLDPTDIEGMNRRFIPVLRQLPQVGSMLIATPDGVEYMLLKDGDAWVNRSTDVVNRDDQTQWYRWNALGDLAKRWNKSLDYDPRQRPWFKGAMGVEAGVNHWTEPYTFFTTKDPGITVSGRIPTPEGELIVAFDVLLNDVSSFTTELEVSPNGKALVLTGDGRVLGLPRDPAFAEAEGIKKFVLSKPDEIGVPSVAEAVANWREGDQPEHVRFNHSRENWLAAFRPYELTERSLWIAAIVPEKDFRGQVRSQRIALIVLALFGIIAATLLAVLFTRRYTRELERAVDEVKTQLGQYRLETKIGEGGMGSVYRASHVLMRRRVAVKLVRADKTSSEFIKRFEREVQMTSQLSHPNTIQIYDYGHTPDGTFYYAMELLNGVSLATFIEAAGRCGPARTIYLMRQICESLREAHSSGLVHRDIKPGNIHVCERGGRYDFMKVLDFGLVKHVGSLEDETNLTGESSFGTPGFVAPEAIRDSSKATARSDIYSVGTVGYALLTAQTLFAERNAVKLLLRQMKEDPVPPSERIRRELAADLDAVIMRMLARDPAERFASMDEVIEALDACEDARGWTQRDARRWWRDHPDLLDTHGEGSVDDEERPTIAVRLTDREA